jgi:glyoxylase-like metal-dependent hydrolase (beta-lactamase superfamily II)
MKKTERRKFLKTVTGIFGVAGVYYAGIDDAMAGYENSGTSITLKGKQDSRITHWDVITIGNLSRNRYWGESDDKAIHKAICTCTVISGKDFHIIVDPSLADEEAMKTELRRRTGLTPDKIDIVFITHQHEDHTAGLKHFPGARWLAGSKVADGLNNNANLPKPVEPVESRLYGSVDIIPTPGHTPDHMSLRFDYRGLSIVIAGDSVATKDFWDERRMYYNVQDIDEAKRSMEKINSIADIIVPGHDNSFFNI